MQQNSLMLFWHAIAYYFVRKSTHTFRSKLHRVQVQLKIFHQCKLSKFWALQDALTLPALRWLSVFLHDYK